MKKVIIVFLTLMLMILISSCETLPQYLDKVYVGGNEYNTAINFFKDGTCNIESYSTIMHNGTYEYNNSEIINVKLLNEANEVKNEIEFKIIDNKIIVNNITSLLESDVVQNVIFEMKIGDIFYENEYVDLLIGRIPVLDDETLYDELGFIGNRLLISNEEELSIYCEALNLSENLFINISYTLDEQYTIDFSKYDLFVYNTKYFRQISLSQFSIKSVVVNGQINLFGCFDYYKNINYPNEYFGIYLVVEKGKYDLGDIVDNIKYSEINFPIDPFLPGGPVVEKPIIYIYPEVEMELQIKFLNEDNLITTYPKYNNGWNIFVKEDGTIYDDSGRSYYALFYDEKMNNTCNFEEGFYVTKNNAITFLEEKLEILGFTEREANEFIMYWLPVLEKNEQSLVYFEQTCERNKNCPLYFSTSPDSMLRVIMHIKKVEDYVDIKEQELYSFERKGLCVVEWGGTTYN